MLPDKIRILILAFEDVLNPAGGMGVHILALSRILKSEFDITIVCVDGNHDGGLYKIDMNDNIIKLIKLEDWICKEHECRILKINDSNDFLTKVASYQPMLINDMFMHDILYYLGRERFDLIHIHDAAIWRVAKNMRALFKVPIVMTCHLSTILSNMGNLSHDDIRYGIQNEGSALNCCNKLITVSHNYKELILDTLVYNKDIVTIHNGVDYKFLSTIRNWNNSHSNDGYKEIVFVGRLVPTKGVDIILDIVKDFPQHEFILISNIAPTLEKYDSLVERINELRDKHSNLVWYNHLSQDKKWEIMSQADIGIMPSLHEPFGIVALEWMGLGIPLIVSNIGGLSEFCNDNNATLIEPTAESLKEAIINHKYDNNKIKNGIQTAKEFSWERVAERTSMIYKDMIEW